MSVEIIDLGLRCSRFLAWGGTGDDLTGVEVPGVEDVLWMEVFVASMSIFFIVISCEEIEI